MTAAFKQLRLSDKAPLFDPEMISRGPETEARQSCYFPMGTQNERGQYSKEALT